MAPVNDTRFRNMLSSDLLQKRLGMACLIFTMFYIFIGLRELRRQPIVDDIFIPLVFRIGACVLNIYRLKLTFDVSVFEWEVKEERQLPEHQKNKLKVFTKSLAYGFVGFIISQMIDEYVMHKDKKLNSVLMMDSNITFPPLYTLNRETTLLSVEAIAQFIAICYFIDALKNICSPKRFRTINWFRLLAALHILFILLIIYSVLSRLNFLAACIDVFITNSILAYTYEQLDDLINDSNNPMHLKLIVSVSFMMLSCGVGAASWSRIVYGKYTPVFLFARNAFFLMAVFVLSHACMRMNMNYEEKKE